jgi:hypothetical protein
MAYTTIKKPSDYFNTKLYSGDGNTTQAITGVGFQPDFTWLKNRSEGTGWHRLSDGVRGVTKILYSNATNAEVTTDANGYIASFDSDGLTVNLGSSGTGTGTNSSGDNFVTWNWLADNTSGSSNTDGDITSTVSANTTSGFSIVSYTGNGTGGATVGHGLGIKPKIVFYKRRDTTSDWTCLQDIEGSLKYGYLNTTAAFSNAGETTPTSSLLYLSSGSDTNASGGTYIAYCFAEKQGYSKFGSYTGNGSTDGTFVYTGFKPAWLIVKQTNASGEGWYMWDNKRSSSGGANENDRYLIASASNADGTLGVDCDFLSNGFKHRYTGSASNGSGASYIYMAFAEEPLVGDNPATAR